MWAEPYLLLLLISACCGSHIELNRRQPAATHATKTAESQRHSLQQHTIHSHSFPAATHGPASKEVISPKRTALLAGHSKSGPQVSKTYDEHPCTLSPSDGLPPICLFSYPPYHPSQLHDSNVHGSSSVKPHQTSEHAGANSSINGEHPCTLSPSNGLPPICLFTYPPYHPSQSQSSGHANSTNANEDRPCTLSPSNGQPPFCPLSFPLYHPSQTKTHEASITTPPSQVYCYLQDMEPGLHMFTEGCICHQGTLTQTLPVRSEDGHSSCDYSTLEEHEKSTVELKEWSTTESNLCQLCPMTATDKSECSSISDCLPNTPTATLQVGTASGVSVGDLTSDKLYTAVSTALVAICPEPSGDYTHCKDSITISDIKFVDENELYYTGELEIAVPESSYNDSAKLGPLIEMTAHGFAHSATNHNCESVGHQGIEKRWYRRWLNYAIRLVKKDEIHDVEDYITLCKAASFASSQFYSRYWREALKPGAQDFIDATLAFHSGSAGDMICDFITELEETVEALITPELLGPEQIIDEEINVGCHEIVSQLGLQ